MGLISSFVCDSVHMQVVAMAVLSMVCVQPSLTLALLTANTENMTNTTLTTMTTTTTTTGGNTTAGSNTTAGGSTTPQVAMVSAVSLTVPSVLFMGLISAVVWDNVRMHTRNC